MPRAPLAAHAIESALDDLAHELGFDPVELRLKNAATEGTHAAYGPTFKKIGFVETLEAAKAHPLYGISLGPNQGWGVACGFWFTVGGESSAQLNINEDGTVTVVTGHPDIGGSRASMVNIAAQMLEVDYTCVRAQIGDTNTIGISATTGGGRVTFAAGMAVTQVTKKVIETLRERAAKIWDIDVDAVIWEQGEARPAGSNAEKFEPLSLADLAAKETPRAGPLMAKSRSTLRARQQPSPPISAMWRLIPIPGMWRLCVTR